MHFYPVFIIVCKYKGGKVILLSFSTGANPLQKGKKRGFLPLANPRCFSALFQTNRLLHFLPL
jgi:hypothetical protein